MTQTDQPPPMVANPYKAAIGQAIAQARPVAGACASALDEAIAAMKGQAWVSTTADAFFAALTACDGDAAQAGQDCLDALQHAHDSCPDQVPAGSAYTRWQRMF